MAKLQDRVALITGGARGIGRAIAESYAQEGARIAIADYDTAGSQATAEELKGNGITALGLHVNVADSDSVQAMIKATLEHFGQLDILVNNAGTGEIPSPIHEKSEADWTRVMAVNATGVFLCMKYGIPPMLQKGKGVIINIASIGGILGFAGNAAYAASKGAVIQLTRAAGVEYAKYGIRTNAIAPGWVRTNMVEQYLQEIPEKRLLAGIPLGRFGEVNEIAALALYLASDEAGFMIGSTVVIDGGITIA